MNVTPLLRIGGIILPCSAQRELENGLAIVGGNAMLYFGLGEVHLHLHEFGIKAGEATLKIAEDYAEKGLKLDPDSCPFGIFHPSGFLSIWWRRTGSEEG